MKSFAERDVHFLLFPLLSLFYLIGLARSLSVISRVVKMGSPVFSVVLEEMLLFLCRLSSVSWVYHM